MADRYLAPGAKDLNSTASWAATFGGATGETVPVAGDVVYILNGNQIIDTNLATLNVDLNAVIIGKDFTGSLGTPGSSATIGCSGVANAPFHIESPAARIYIAAGTAGIDVLRIISSGTVRLTGGTTVRVDAYQGDVYLDSSGVVTTLNAGGANITAADAATEFTTINGSAGQLTDYRGAATGVTGVVNVHGTFKMIAHSLTGYDTVNIGGAPGNQGCRFNIRQPMTVATMNLFSGTSSIEGCPSAPTITVLNRYGRPEVTRWIKSDGLVTASVGTDNNFSLSTEMSLTGGGTSLGGGGAFGP